ncbi:MAG: hypothetical protein K2N05_09040 [Muribaculaceae bacterium]|nr:hypothetical protein [Muribaculaceae bacterium]
MSRSPRNPKIAGTMFKAGFIDTWGRGYNKIYTGFEKNGFQFRQCRSILEAFKLLLNVLILSILMGMSEMMSEMMSETMSEMMSETMSEILPKRKLQKGIRTNKG